jgi:hypothetical protein
MRCILRCLTFAICLAIAGCNFGASESLPDIEIERLENWPNSKKPPQGTPGIDFGTVWYVREAEPLNKPLAIIWFDDRCSINGSAGKGSPGIRFTQTTLRFDNGKKVAIECHVQAGKDKPSIDLRIDGQPCDFEQGNFFLVSTSGETTKIKQTDRDIGLKGMRFDLDSIIETAKTDKEIREFFTAAATSNAGTK